MSYQLLPNFIFLFSLFGIIVLVLRRLPEAAILDKENPSAEQSLFSLNKGLPLENVSKLKTWLKYWTGKLWQFILEAKDLKPAAEAGYRIKKLVSSASRKQTATHTNPEEKQQPRLSETEILENIKKEPKNLANYEALAKLYVDNGNFNEAAEIYGYLLKHKPAESQILAMAGWCQYQLQNFSKSAELYQQSVGLDSTHPNRYYNLAVSYKKIGEKAKALTAIEKALELEPQNEKYKQTKESLS